MSRSSSTRCRGTSSSRRCEAVTDCRWVLLYVKRWLAAPLQHPDGTLVERDKGTPQGSAVSPILANLFMHYAFDRGWPGTIRAVRSSATPTMPSCTARAGGRPRWCWPGSPRGWKRWGLRLHPDKTRIVYCKDSNRRGEHEHTSFTFLGFAFRPREARRKNGVYFTSFLPAISPEALKAKGAGSARCGSTGAPTCRWTTWRDG